MKKWVSTLLLLVLSVSVFGIAVQAEQTTEGLYKFVKKGDGTFGYDTNTPVFYSNGSSEQVMIPTTYTQEKEQFKSSWVATISNLNFAKAGSEEAFRAQYDTVLNDFETWNMNAVIFQIRPLLDAYYPSKLNPWSEFITSGIQGANPGYDPLAIMVEETHKRGMEYHAWFNPYRVTNTKMTTPSILAKIGATKEEALAMTIPEQIAAWNKAGILADNNYAVLHPQNVLRFDEKLFLNPGIPEVQDNVAETIKEVVTNYDVDAIHFDDYFYPYRITVDGKNVLFGDLDEDAQTFATYGIPNGYPDTKEGIDDWRRDNITTLIDKVKNTIDTHNEAKKTAVQFGISPFGIWEHKANNPLGSNTPTSSSQSFSQSIFADTYQWIKDEKIDYMTPQIYWSFDQGAAPYGELARWWSRAAEGTRVQIYVGHANYKHVGNGGWEAAWMNPEEIPNQMRFNQLQDKISGSVLFSYNDIKKSDIASLPEAQKPQNQAKNDAIDLLKKDYFAIPSLVPSKPWLAHQEIAAPIQVKQTADTLTWADTTANSARHYVVYKGTGTAEEIIANPANIVTRVWRGEALEFSLPITKPGTYVVTALDAASNESTPAIAQIAGADVTVLYQDEDGKEIAPTEILRGNIGENFAIEIKAVAGYKERGMQASGTFTDKAQTIIVSYEKEADEVAPTDPEEIIVTPPKPEVKPNKPAEKAPEVEKVTEEPASKSVVKKDLGALPTTGDTSMDLVIVFGFILSATGVLMLIRWRRKQA
ncbi:LPXTG-motif cell wall anchor domain-containing protein [Listeria weihenstephanensis FSL R9-0317]|uniref:Cell wall protein n=1 Tax=Listeria weihenstephanensis TaxID=1006155 RepID=A0A1S7FSS9_9LIST|nr:family 10 glycosylhydrolase [Listeria weihenstephanensis]AQY50453.1 cell wall protein [Listeria weihenstephanensis]EUJ41466.1 LPXTG-motif cell wall anchor domain-containing protein [Listeria weihenstephanensis FSL R9-0317]